MATSSTTNTSAATATCCFLNLRQNSRQGVRTLASCAEAAAAAGVGEMEGVVMLVGIPFGLAAFLLVADGGVDVAIEHVHHQIDEDELQREHQHQRLDEGVV